jgi:hypothetical protein
MRLQLWFGCLHFQQQANLQGKYAFFGHWAEAEWALAVVHEGQRHAVDNQLGEIAKSEVKYHIHSFQLRVVHDGVAVEDTKLQNHVMV